ncbi:ferredoxin [Phaeovulum sp.]|uniref:ferredoxin n=1 Tax=Phaeovulum sp. TaxID=2934796 RepID=UPI00272FFC83|nr:ferredoxin [Phaeovulum sp.]MDP1668741.1 ferredoxin [Phaeovulum sp.]MDZ4120557.1 ferredoxin [Phaeovulum sp.]
MNLATIEAAAMPHRLFVSGAFHPAPADATPEGIRTLVLLSPAEPGFWPHVSAAPEFADAAPDPLDRWSSRVIGALAEAFGARALFPFGGPPWRPFFSWALRSGEAFRSPVSLLVHHRMGLWASYRGALALREALALPSPRQSPCEGCPAPCRTACPVAALGPGGYALEACHSYLDTPAGADCLSFGCGTRRACPLSAAYGRLAGQSAWHMRQFHQ